MAQHSPLHYPARILAVRGVAYFYGGRLAHHRGIPSGWYDQRFGHFGRSTSPVVAPDLQGQSAFETHLHVLEHNSLPGRGLYLGPRSPSASQVYRNGRRSVQFAAGMVLLTYRVVMLQEASRGVGQRQADRSLRFGTRSGGHVPEEVLSNTDATAVLHPAHRPAHVLVGRVPQVLLAHSGPAPMVRDPEPDLAAEQLRPRVRQEVLRQVN